MPQNTITNYKMKHGAKALDSVSKLIGGTSMREH